jgi:exonuclease SbcC
MRFINLELKNWACHDYLQVPLSKSLQIEGRNGTGKSSILEAIRFIFSEKSRGYKRKIKNGKDFAKVKLTLLKKDQNDLYVIEKILFSQKPSKARMLKNSQLIADNPSSVYQHIQEILLSEEIIDKLAYVPQGKLTEILDDLKRKGGRQELDSLLGLDKLEKVYRGAGEELIKKKEQLNFLSSELEKFPEDAENFYKNEMKNLQEKVEKLLSKIKGLEHQREEVNKKLNKKKEKIQEIEKIKLWKEKLEKKLNKINLDLARLEEELSSAKKFLNSVKEKKKDFEILKKEEEHLRKYPQIKNLLIEKNNLEEKMNSTLLIAEDKRKLNLLKEKLKEKFKIQVEYNEKEKILRNLEKELAINKEKFKEKVLFLESLDELKKEKRCPRCGQFLSKEHIDREKQETSKEIKKIKFQTENFEKKLNLERNSFEHLSKKLEKMKREEMEFKHLEELINKKISERKTSEERIRELERDLALKGYSNESLAQVESNINKLNNIQGKINLLRDDVEKEKELQEEKIPKLEQTVSKLSQEKKSFQVNLKKLEEKYDGSLLEKLKKEKEISQEEYYKLLGEIQNQKFQLEGFNEKIERLEEEKEKFLEKKEKFNKTKREVRLLERARELFHTDKGIPKYLREKYISRLNFLITLYFRKINQKRSFYKEVNFNKEYELELKTENGILTLDQISGGEKSQLAIAFRLSLIDLLSPVKLLILDEPFGSLDKEHREILGESMNKIAQDKGGQLILVTHIPVDSLQLPERLDLGGY